MNAKEEIFSKVDSSIVEYWKSLGLTENDFYCRDCGNLIIDLDEIKYLKTCITKYRKFFTTNGHIKKYIESDHNRWAIIGRTLTGKIYHRKICWECFFKKLRATTDIARKARKSCWYKKLNQGINAVPTASTSPSGYFKLLFDISDEDLNKERSKFDTASIESFIRRFGEEEGTKKFEEYKKRQAYTCSKEYMAKTRGWTEEQWNEFNQSRASTKDNFIRRYGKEAGEKKWNEYCAYEAYAGSSLTYFINVYGEKLGKLKYKEICDKKNFRFKPYSEPSQQLFELIDNKLGDIAKNSLWAKKSHEFETFITNINGVKKIIRVDYYLNGKIIEFNGDYWHANPDFYLDDEIVCKNMKATEIHKRDQHRYNELEKLGFKVKVVWENDFNYKQDEVVNECCEFLKS